MSDTGTIDITKLVATMKDTWVTLTVEFVYQAASSTVYTAWLRAPIVAQLFKFFVKLIVAAIANGAEMGAFFLNTALRKSGQAQDYVDAVDAKNALPPTATREEYKLAEQKEMAAFRNFVMLSN